jgi:Mrp family chromosome partitioning ATPase
VRDGVRVTLVDADRGEPRLNRVFGAPDAPGVADVLAGRARVKEILHVGAGGNLRFLAAGSPADPTPLTETGLRTLFRDLADRDTDIVLVSGPSVWQAPLVGPLEKAASGMVLVAPDADRGIPPAESVARARRILSNGYKPTILGVVVGTDEDLATAGQGEQP